MERGVSPAQRGNISTAHQSRFSLAEIGLPACGHCRQVWSQRTRTGHLECIEVCAGECGKHHSVAVASADHTDSSTSSDCALHRATAVEDT